MNKLTLNEPAISYQDCSLSVNVSLSARSDLNKLFDDDVTSCVVTMSLFTRRDVYTAGLFVTSVSGTSEKDKIALNITFESDVICLKRKVGLLSMFCLLLKSIKSWNESNIFSKLPVYFIACSFFHWTCISLSPECFFTCGFMYLDTQHPSAIDLDLGGQKCKPFVMHFSKWSRNLCPQRMNLQVTILLWFLFY